MTTLADLTRRAHVRYAHHPAVHDGQRRLTFAELGAMARRTANRLLVAGLRPGDRVVLALDNRPEVLAVEHALFLTGMVRVALSSRLHGREVAGIAADCTAAAVVCEPTHLAALTAQRPELPRLRLLAVADQEPAEQADVDSAVSLAELVGPGVPDTPPDVPDPLPDDVAALMYTSGTTGEPKGAVATHAAWVSMVRAFWAELPPSGPGDVVLHVAPMSHFGGSAGSAYTLRGAAVVPVRRFDPPAVLDLLAEYQVTTIPLVPTMLKDLTVEAERRRRAGDQWSPGTLRAVPYGGAAISAQALDRAWQAFGDVLYQCYGLSEALAPLTVLSAHDHRPTADGELPARLSSAGRPVPDVELSVVDSDPSEGRSVDVSRDGVPRGGTGEVVVRGTVVTRGYWNRPDETRDVLTSDGWFRTGDLGYLDEGGYLHLVDRRREVIVSGGFNVYPSEVERAIAELDGVQDVVVVAIPHPRWGEAVAAVVVRRPGYDVTADDVVAACRVRLASYKKPVHVEFDVQLPLTGNRKLSRRLVQERYWTGSDRRVGQ
ncbi:class I adenylate-forming enzyme family protein [Actinopolymorpha rutila]|uniref:Acyl-CoA synthetase (AMP-forming)/AMP-acid ligase II n=1 Tax=Actinopolymorpha rutila TaxID=446787 RepID=A0A852ZT96_9ACTN|nr:AMP-binding protein [Actinopolymorpha rutila]NYH92220.1 acyl-CoA synthetase (AMP-forming)/AMP-acid ligase II [Actinopolymorpha rutila]